MVVESYHGLVFAHQDILYHPNTIRLWEVEGFTASGGLSGGEEKHQIVLAAYTLSKRFKLRWIILSLEKTIGIHVPVLRLQITQGKRRYTNPFGVTATDISREPILLIRKSFDHLELNVPNPANCEGSGYLHNPSELQSSWGLFKDLEMVSVQFCGQPLQRGSLGRLIRRLMSEKEQLDNALKRSRLGSTRAKQKLNQKSTLDLFPKKQEPVVTTLVDLNDPPVGIQEQPRRQPFDSLDYELPKIADEPVDIPLIAEQTATNSGQMASAPLLEAFAAFTSNSTRFHTPEIQVVKPATGLREDDPIVVDSSPVRSYSQPTKVPAKALYSIFAPRTRRESFVTPVNSAQTPLSHREAPFPDCSSQHVRGPQTTYNAPQIPYPLRHHATRTSGTSVSLSDIIASGREVDIAGDDANKLRFDASTSQTVRAAHLTSIPTSHLQSHPVIAHLVETATSTDSFSGHSHRLWSDKWRPSRADHVLGNEEQATFLREWLCALEVHFRTASAPSIVNGIAASQSSGSVVKGKTKSITTEKRGTKRRSVIRAVDKSRKRRRIDSDDDDDSWIVYSDNISEDETPPIDEFVDNARRLHRRLTRTRSSSTTQTFHSDIFQDCLTNTILLNGPNSCGKTATVYACADELGWEVFEVYPGIGKRNGTNLDNLVGEVGKNHLVRKTRLRGEDSGTNAKADGSLISALAHGSEKFTRQVGIPNDHRERSASVTGFGFVEESDKAHHEEHEATARQSLILLEEVDVLFKEDANFWGSLISLIRDCKRPVILTCNDISLVPVADLPLQNVLNLQLCSTSVATSFLQALCCAEGYLLDRESLSRFYESPGLFELDPPRMDLRRAILNLQLWCPENTMVAGTTIRDQEIEDMLYWDWPDDRRKSSDASSYQVRQMYSIGGTEAHHAELVSFADCYLLRKVGDMPKEIGLNESASTGEDNILGYRIVQMNGSTFHQNQFGYNDLDELIMSTVIELSRGAHGCTPSAGTRGRTARVHYDETVKELGHNVVAGQSQIMRRPVFDLEYLPWIRQMVAAEDRQEEAILKNDTVGAGRKTRNSQKFSRMIELSHEGDRTSATKSATQSPSIKSTNKSPLMPLAPLEYLKQNQRRGSITDPSLHAAPLPPINPHMFRQTASSSSIPTTPGTVGPSSSYVFGDATATMSENPALRKILRSPSIERENSRATEGMVTTEEARRPSTSGSEQQMVGVKRKMSIDKGVPGDAPLAGPGISGFEMEMEAPPPKRRGSAIDTSRIASLSLNERRNSVDSRGSHWTWASDRRDSTSSILSAYSPAYSGTESPQGRLTAGVATFAWPISAGPHPSESNNMQHEGDPNVTASSQLHMMPPINFNQDRRMSVPNVLSASPPTSSGPTRVLRSRSRPPSRQSRAENTHSESPEDQSADPIASSSSSSKAVKDSGATPYSRSPELRVSHKLAERKRRKEMKDLFDELRDQLPADRGMKASKWEILSKAIDFVNQLKQSHQDMAREIDMLRHELDAVRQNAGLPPFPGPPPPHLVYAQGPIPAPFPLPPGVLPHPHPLPHPAAQHPQHPQHSLHPRHPQPSPQPQPPLSRPTSSQNMLPPGEQNSNPQNGDMPRPEVHPTT
ncbi:hypothetical protein J3R30DRAFT_3682661 [Lentinula aciculospora]|uniref:BHLH domain-containing protein n=1 Tax=Lentinula aciculospora TaxID=153920 RepID=A0A9W9ACY2_9AGAR|nr:hypothetical protein J3R30DRAFT_3682661 [Lentinula aciculospora]